MTRARRTELDGLPEWALIGAAWEIGVGEPLFLEPGERVVVPAQDTLVRVLFGTLDVRLEDGAHGLDAGWVMVADAGSSVELQVRTRTQLRLFARPRIEAAHRLANAYHRCMPPGSSPVPSGLHGAFVPAAGLSGLVPWIPVDGGVLLCDAEGPLSQTLAALPAEVLQVRELQHPYEGPSCPRCMAFHDGGDAHLGIMEALAAAGVALRREELFLRPGGEVARWTPPEGGPAPHLLDALARTLPCTGRAAREVMDAQRRLQPVLSALARTLPGLRLPCPLALARPLDEAAARAWSIGPIPLSASPRKEPLGDGDYETTPGAVGGRFHTCAIIVGPASTAERLVVDVEWAADHEMTVHRCSLERRQGAIAVVDERCIVQVD